MHVNTNTTNLTSNKKSSVANTNSSLNHNTNSVVASKVNFSIASSEPSGVEVVRPNIENSSFNVITENLSEDVDAPLALSRF